HGGGLRAGERAGAGGAEAVRGGGHVGADLADPPPHAAQQRLLVRQLAHATGCACAPPTSAARAAATAAATCRTSSRVPSPVAPATAYSSMPRAAKRARAAGRRSRVSTRARFPRTTALGFP